MPKRPRPGDWEVLYAELPAAKRIKDRLAEQAARNNRSPTAELLTILDGLLPAANGDRPRGRPPRTPPAPPAPQEEGGG